VLVNNEVIKNTYQVQEIDIDLPQYKTFHDKFNNDVPIAFIRHNNNNNNMSNINETDKEIFRWWVDEDRISKLLQQEKR